MDEQQQEEAPRRNRGMNWLGLVAFIVIAFGRRIVGFVQWLFSGATGLLPGSFDLALVLGGAAVVAVVVATLVTLRASRSGDTRGPTLPPAPRANAPMPPFGGPLTPRTGDPAGRLYGTPTMTSLPTAVQLPSPPRFEPIINGKAVLASIILALLLGGAVALFLLARP